MSGKSETPTGQAAIPPIFLAYPSDADTRERMTRLAVELRESSGAHVVTWEDLSRPGFLFDEIASAIDAAELLLAECTDGNSNVLFEVGYAIGRGKHVLLLINETRVDPIQLPPLAHVRQIRYSQRHDIMHEVMEMDFGGKTLADRLGLNVQEAQRGGLYFIPPRNARDLTQAIWSACDSGSFAAKTIEVGDSDYDSLESQALSIALAELFVTALVSQQTRDHVAVNAQLMLFAGIAAGMGKEYFVVGQEPMRRPLDLGANLARFQTEGQAERFVANWLKTVASQRIASPPPQRSVAPRESLVHGLFLGSLDARADFHLPEYFIKTPEFIQAREGQRHLFVGAKGSGKTALFEELKSELGRRNSVLLVSISPAEFEFSRLSAVFDEQVSSAHWEFVYSSFWRFILLTEVLRRMRDEWIDLLVQRSMERMGQGRPTPGAVFARTLLKWFDENDELVSEDFVARVTSVLAQMSSMSGTDDIAKRKRIEEILQQARMYDVQRALKETLRDTQIRLIIDDLDRNWNPSTESSRRLIIALLNAVEDVRRGLGQEFVPSVFLRRDVFQWLVANDLELLKRDPAVLSWTPESLELLIAERISQQLKEREITEPRELWGRIFPREVGGEQTPDFVISRTLLRPRDVIQFCQKALETAQRAGRQSIASPDLFEAWETTGELLLAQIETEYQHEYPGLSDIALGMLEWPESIPLPRAKERFVEALARSPGQTGFAGADAVVEALYRTEIIGVSTAGGNIWYEHRRQFDDLRPALSSECEVIVHPAFRQYLKTSA